MVQVNIFAVASQDLVEAPFERESYGLSAGVSIWTWPALDKKFEAYKVYRSTCENVTMLDFECSKRN